VFELLAVPQRGIPYVQMGPEDLNPKIFRITLSVDNVVAQTGTELVPTLSPEDGERSFSAGVCSLPVLDYSGHDEQTFLHCRPK
jgi:hypothetical protein